MKRINVLLIFFIFYCGSVCAESIFDAQRQRQIPIEIHLPDASWQCAINKPCSVAFLSAGYGVSHKDYQFLVNALLQKGHLVLTIGHELPQDPPLSKTGDLYKTRAENWQRGAETIVFVQEQLKQQFPEYDFNKLLLVGHSNGGDISAWLANSQPHRVKQVITLDHRRVPLPRNPDISVLSIRASDFPADPGVLPSEQEKSKFPICVTKIPDARHNDMTDYGPKALKQAISTIISRFLETQTCL